MEASIFATMALKKLGVANVLAKAGSELHGAILERVGADRVVFAEREMGQRVAHSFARPRRRGLPGRGAAFRHRQGPAAGVLGGPIVQGP